VLAPLSTAWPQVSISLAVRRQGELIFSGESHTDKLRRRPDELVDYLGRALDFPDGVVLLSGTGVVPPDEFSLAAGDVVQIVIEGLGELENTVKVV
jgi:2-dehydro-3-deoxy-D-arabinonate dehydratase